METLLDQSEIDAMVKAARGGTASSAITVKSFDYREIGMARQQLEMLSALHEGFARSLKTPSGRICVLDFKRAWPRRNTSATANLSVECRKRAIWGR